MSEAKITITVTGPVAVGKTTVMVELERALKAAFPKTEIVLDSRDYYSAQDWERVRINQSLRLKNVQERLSQITIKETYTRE